MMWEESNLTNVSQQAHMKSDVDSGARAQHHTLGKGPTQASPGNHKHKLDIIEAVSGPGPTVLTLSDTPLDVAGCSIDMECKGAGDEFFVLASFDIIKNDATNAAIRGYLHVNGTNQGANLNVRLGGSAVGSGITGMRSTYTKSWKVTGLTPGTKTFKLVVDQSTATPGSFNIASDTTKITVIKTASHGF